MVLSSRIPPSQPFNVDTTSEIAFSCENQGLPENEIHRRINQTVSLFQIENLIDRNIFHLSGGEKQKIFRDRLNSMEELKKLKELLDIGAITKREYKEKKHKIMKLI